jgi:predicted chitinase
VSKANFVLPERAGMKAFLGKDVSDSFLIELKRGILLYEINGTRNRLCHFLAQCAHESARFRYTLELASGEAYEGRADLGNTQPGDGSHFKGAGWIQLTGRKNYTAFSKAVDDAKVITGGARYVAKNYPTASAGFWWKMNRVNDKIDQGYTAQNVSRLVNRGNASSSTPANGEEERVAYHKRALEIWG